MLQITSHFCLSGSILHYFAINNLGEATLWKGYKCRVTMQMEMPKRSKHNSHQQKVHAPVARSMLLYHTVIFKHRASIHSWEQKRYVYFHCYSSPSTGLVFLIHSNNFKCSSQPSQRQLFSALMTQLGRQYLSSTRHVLALTCFWFFVGLFAGCCFFFSLNRSKSCFQPMLGGSR